MATRRYVVSVLCCVAISLIAVGVVARHNPVNHGA